MENISFKKLSQYTLGVWGSAVIGVIYYPIITRLISIEDFGRFSLFNTYIGLFTTIGMVGMDQSFVRYYYSKVDDDKNRLLYTCIIFPLCNALLISGVLYILNLVNLLDLLNNHIILFFMASTGSIINMFSTSVLRLEEKSCAYAVINILNKLTYLIISVLALKIFGSSYLLLITALAVSNSISGIVGIINSKNIWRFRGLFSIGKSEKSRELFIYGIPIALTMGLNWINTSAGKLILQHYSNMTEVGLFAAGNTLITPIILLQNAFLAIWFPMVIKIYENKDENKTKSFLIKANDITSAYLYAIAIVIIIFRHLLADIFLAPAYHESSEIMALLIFSVFSKVLTDITGVGMQFKNKMNLNIVASGVSCLINIIACIALIPYFNARGAAMAISLSSVVYYTTRTLLSKRCYYVNYNIVKNIITQGLIFLCSVIIVLRLSSAIANLSIIVISIIIFLLFFKEYKLVMLLVKKRFVEKWKG